MIAVGLLGGKADETDKGLTEERLVTASGAVMIMIMTNCS